MANRADGVVLRYAPSDLPAAITGRSLGARDRSERALMLCTIYDFAAAMQDMQTRNHKLVKAKWRRWWLNTGEQ